MTDAVVGPSLPERIPVAPGWTASARDSPLGRATALVDARDRYYAIAADARRVRALPEVARRCGFLEEALVSPDGTRVAISGRGDLLVIDLTTGIERAFLLDSGDAWAMTAAWSWDSRRIAFIADGGVSVLELMDGRVQRLDLDGEECFSVAFAPDGQHLAVDFDDAVALAPLNGDSGDVLILPSDPDEELSGSAAFSPDGRLLAVEVARPTQSVPVPVDLPLDELDELEDYAVSLLERGDDGKWRRARHQVRVDGIEYLDLAGWRSATEPVFVEHRADGLTVVVRDLDGAAIEVLARADNQVFDVQLALGLIPRLRTRPVGTDDIGSPPRWLSALSAVTGGAAAKAAHVVDRTLHKRRPRRPR